MSTTTYSVPTIFFEDHCDRDCLIADFGDVLIKHGARRSTVALTPEDAAELLSDAYHYASSAGEYDLPSLTGSARSTVGVLWNAGVRAPGHWTAKNIEHMAHQINKKNAIQLAKVQAKRAVK